MKNNFYSAIKEDFKREDFDVQKYTALMDDYTKSLECKGELCNNMKNIKQTFVYVLRKYKRLLSLKKQNEDIFSQILHDIKSPILGVKFALEGTKRSELEEEIYNINVNVLLVIQNFLTLYSFKDGFKSLDFSHIYPLEVVKKELELYSPLLRKKNIQVVYLNNINPCIYSHKAIFARIVSNLISNATKYSPQDGKIKLGICKYKDEIVFKISNFTQQHYSDDELSFGMGLFIIKRLARRIKSTLCIKKSNNKITFELKIPKVDCLNHER